MNHWCRHIIAAVAATLSFNLLSLGAISYGGGFGDLVQIEQLGFYPDTLAFPGDSVAVIVVQNREEGPIQHELLSTELFQDGTLVSLTGTGEIAYDTEGVAKVLLSPGEEVVILFYARKGWTYAFQCTLNGHAMQATIRTF